MAKRNVEEELGKLNRLRDLTPDSHTLTALRKALGDRVNLVAAKAAQVIGDMRITTLAPDLASALARLFERGADADPQCWAKNAIAKALIALDHDESATFLTGQRYVQMESTYGGKVDTAVTLRSLCTLALVQCADLPRAAKLRHLLTSINDPEESVRIDAIRAIEQMEGEEAALLLRMKAAVGDPRASVVGQALESLLRLEGPAAVEFARSFLRASDEAPVRELRSTAEEFVEEAALAIGASRLPAVVGALIDAWTAHPRPVFLQAISASRQESGFTFLLGLIASGRSRDAAAAVDALSLHRDSPEVRAAVLRAVETRGSAELNDRVEKGFAPR
jgi:hypothetical protein